MELGGPVWHVSIKDLGLGWHNVEAQAHRWLSGVGDSDAGEWIAENPPFLHVRRRLSADEAQLVGPVVDIRGTWEHEKRVNRIRKYLPAGWLEMVGENI